jgi:neutral amino acid transport system ATP-binding protein
VTDEPIIARDDEPATPDERDLAEAEAALSVQARRPPPDWAQEPGAPKPDPILVVDGVQRAFSGLVAVDVEHLEFQRNAITALIGPNGAGKTTLFNVLTGFDEATHGSWALNGNQLAGRSAYRIARAGMVRSFQLTKSLARLTVAENMALAAPDQTGEGFLGALFARPRWRSQERANLERIDDLLQRFKLDRLRDEFAGTLSGGQRKLLDMARALMSNPTLICLDEPMAGVNPALTQSLLKHITDLREEGLTVIFVEHDMDVVMEISDWVVVLAEGQVIAEGPPAAIAANSRVIEAYLGTDVGAET